MADIGKNLREGDLDERILDLLRDDGRMSNSALAQALGIAQSTAHARVRALMNRGIITGFTTSVDQERLGLALQAIIGVTLRPGARRESIERFSEEIRGLEQVLQLFFVGSADDFIIHVAVRDTAALRQFVVENLSGHASVASTRTSIVFEYHRNATAGSFGAG